MSDDEIIEVVQAHKEGKPIQFRNKRWPDWTDTNPYQNWDFCNTEYRVAPRKPREWTAAVDKFGRLVQPVSSASYPPSSFIRVREVID